MDKFEKYLQEIHAENYHGTDDNMPDAFEAWLAELDGNDLIRHANLFGEALATIIKRQKDEIERLMKLTKEAVDELNKIKEMVK